MSILSTPILGTITNGLFGWIKQRGERKAAAQQQKVDLIKSKDSHNHSWEIAALEGEGWELGVIRMAAFTEVTLGTFISIYDPTYSREMWAALAEVPNWVIGLKVTIFGWAFASTPVKNAAAGLVGSVVTFPKQNKE